MGEPRIDLPGIEPKRIRGALYVTVKVSQLEAFKRSNAPVSVDEIADEVGIANDALLNSLLRNGANHKAVRWLYADVVGKPFPGLDVARRELDRRAHQTHISGTGRFLTATPTYQRWGVPRDIVLTLPLTSNVRTVLREATAQRRRTLKLRALQPVFDALEKQASEIRLQTDLLEHVIRRFDAYVEPKRGDVARIVGLDELLRILLENGKTPPETEDRVAMQAYRERFHAFRKRAVEEIITNPPDALVGGFKSDRDARAAWLHALIKDDAFKQNVQKLTANRDLAPPALWHDTCASMELAYRMLMLTPRAEQVQVDFEAAIAVLASKSFDTSSLPTTGHEAFDDAVRNAPEAPPADSPLLILLKQVVPAVPNAVGNLPGPHSLAAAVVEMAGLQMMPNAMSNPTQAGALSGKLYRALSNAAGLSMRQRVRLLESVQQGDLGGIRKIKWSSRFMTGPSWGSAMAGANLIALAFAITSDDDNTARKWASIIQSGAGTAASISDTAVSFGRFARFASKTGFLRTAAKGLGVVGGVAAVMVGYENVQEELETADVQGAWIAGAGAAGGAMSVVGWLMGAAAAAGITGVGVPVSGGLMVAGSLIGVASAIVTGVQGALTAGSAKVFENSMRWLNRSFGALQSVAPFRPPLTQQFDTLMAQQHDLDFWDADISASAELQDVEFRTGEIAQIVNEDESEVRARLKADEE